MRLYVVKIELHVAVEVRLYVLLLVVRHVNDVELDVLRRARHLMSAVCCAVDGEVECAFLVAVGDHYRSVGDISIVVVGISA